MGHPAWAWAGQISSIASSRFCWRICRIDDAAPDWGSGGFWGRFAGEDGVEGLFGEDVRGAGSFEAEVDVAVVDAAGVDGMPARFAGYLDRDFWCDAGVSQAEDVAAGVEENVAAGIKGVLVGGDVAKCSVELG